MPYLYLTPERTFNAVAFFIGEIGDGLNYFQGMYLVVQGWNASAIGYALSLMGFTTLFMQTFAGDLVDKVKVDRRILLAMAALTTAGSASTIMFVRDGNRDHMLMYITKVLEGVAASFMTPCLTALTLANFGPRRFDAIMAKNIFWGLVGYAIAATLVGASAYVLYPNIKYCFLVMGFSALMASILTSFLPEGHPQLGSGFHIEDEQEKKALDEESSHSSDENTALVSRNKFVAASYWSVMTEPRTLTFCLTGFFFHLANANVLMVLGELMIVKKEGDDLGEAKRNAIPLMAIATLVSQFFMCSSVSLGGYLSKRGTGRKAIFLAGIATLPIRCALVILWKDAGPKVLLLTQILDGIEGGLFRVIHPLLVVDLTFGTGRFNIVMGLTNSFFWFGRTFSTLLGQMAVERYGHVVSLCGSMVVSCVPIIIFGCFMPETIRSRRTKNTSSEHYDISLKPKTEDGNLEYKRMDSPTSHQIV